MTPPPRDPTPARPPLSTQLPPSLSGCDSEICLCVPSFAPHNMAFADYFNQIPVQY